MKKFKFITDPGHAWLEVALGDIESASVSLDEFSPCSFIEGSNVYLEEDVDAPLFMLAYETKYGSFMLETVHVHAFDRSRERLPGTRYDFERTMHRCVDMEAALNPFDFVNFDEPGRN